MYTNILERVIENARLNIIFNPLLLAMIMIHTVNSVKFTDKKYPKFVYDTFE